MTQLLTLILLSCYGFHFFSASADAQACSDFQFSSQLGRRLRCNIYKTLKAVDVFDCHEKCAEEMNCFSTNIYQSDNGTNVCELIKGTESSVENPDCLVTKQGSEYNELSSTASCSSFASCEAGKPRKALPNNWYQIGSSAFKLFEERKTHTGASAVCSANGGALATINSDDENQFVTDLHLKEQLSKRELLIKEELKPHKRWKLDGTDQEVTLVGGLVAKKDEYNRSAALHFTGTAGSYATTPSWDISTKTFSIALWVKLESIPTASYHFYSYWENPYIFWTGVTSTTFYFAARKKGGDHNDFFRVVDGKIVLNKWIHLVFVWDRDTKQATFYQDGQKIRQTTPVTTPDLDFPAPTRSVFDVGHKRDSGTIMKGCLRELLVFDRVASNEEVEIIQGATVLDPRVWIGASQNYQNLAPVSQPNTNCFSARSWGTYQWEQVECDRKLGFICKKPV